MKSKLLSVIITFTLILGLCYPTKAYNEITITNPPDGSTVYELTEITADINCECDYVIIKLDGTVLEKLEYASGVSAALPQNLSLGTHMVEVITIGKCSSKETSEFVYQKKYDEPYCDLDMSVGLSNKFWAAEKGTELKTVNGRGENNDALAFIIIEDRPAGSSRLQPFLQATTGFSVRTVFEVDMYFSKGNAFEIETKNNALYGALFSFKNDGTVKDFDLRYPIGEWFRFKLDIDFTCGKGFISIGTFDENDNVEYETREFDKGKKGMAVSQIKFQPTFYEASAGDMVAFDNLKVTETKTVSTFSSLFYEDNGVFVASEDGILPGGVSKIRLSGASQFDISSLVEKITVLADGIEFEVSNMSAEEDNIEISFSKPLPKQKNINVTADKSVLLLNKKECGADVEYKFSTSPDIFYASSVEFKCGDDYIYSPYSLGAGDNLTAELKLTNSLPADKTATLIIAVYKGDEISGFTSKAISVASGAENQTENISIVLKEEYTSDISINVFLLDSFSHRIPLSNVWSFS